jgi:ADP-heptose:LPS heptosyltransferase
MEPLSFKRILISRTDNIGDVLLTLPMAGILKKQLPNTKILFLGKTYTQAIVECCEHIDEFYDWTKIQSSSNKIKEFKKINPDVIIHVFPNKEIAKIAKQCLIPLRIGTNRRWYHHLYCNKTVALSRQKSLLHESQLNLKLLIPLNIHIDFSKEILHYFYGFTQIKKLPQNFFPFFEKQKFNIILHPKSKGSAREWSLEYFAKLAEILPQERFKIFVTGSAEETPFIQKHLLSKTQKIHDLSGMLSLSELISFINQCDGFIGNSTGPLHIAAALNKKVLGFYPPLASMLPTRWGPLGNHVFCVLGKPESNLTYCKAPCKRTTACRCFQNLTPIDVKKIIEQWEK